MYARDSRAAQGGGYVVQDHAWRKEGLTSTGRVSEWCERWVGYNEHGQGLAKSGTLGDLCGYQMWPVANRANPAWRHSFLVVTVAPNVSTPSSGGGSGGDHETPDTIPSRGTQTDFFGETPPEGTPGPGLPPGQGDLYPQVPGGSTTKSAHAPTADAGTSSDSASWIFIPGSPGEMPGNGFVGWYSPNAGGWVGNYYGFVEKSAPVGETDNTQSGQPGSGGNPIGGGSTPGVLDPGKRYVIDSDASWFIVASDPHFVGGGLEGSGGDFDLGLVKTNAANVKRAKPLGPDTIIQPTIGPAFVPDSSLAALRVDTDVNSPRPFWPTFPYGTFGVSLTTMDLSTQIADFMPTDPRLCAVHKASKQTDSGSLVYDLRPDGRWDDTRGATMQTLCRVVKGARGGLSMGGLVPNSGATGSAGRGWNSIALNIGSTGGGEALGGFVADGAYGGATRLGRWSVRDGGFLDVGAHEDQHKLGSDFDGSPINPCHISTLAFHTDGGTHDGPIDFETGTVQATDAGYLVKVHWWFDKTAAYNWPRDKPTIGGKGMWKLYASSLVSSSPTTPSGPRPPGLPPRPPIEDGPRQPGGGGLTGNPLGNGGPPQTGGGSGPGFGSGQISAARNFVRDGDFVVSGPVDAALGEIRRGNSSLMKQREHAVMTAELALPGILARAQRYRQGARDTRYRQGWGDADAVAVVEDTSPVVGRLAAFAAQGGHVGGPYLGDTGSGAMIGGSPWAYTQTPGVSRERGGTAPGLWMVIPPEVDGADVDDDFAPRDVTLSKTYFAVGPGAKFASGLPELASGGIRSGWSWGQPSAGSTNLTFYAHNGAGTAAEFVTFDPTGFVNIKGATALSALHGSGLSVGRNAAQKVGFHGAASLQDGGYSSSGLGSRKTIDNTTTLAQLLDYAATLQAALIAKGVIAV